jgi:hypothetical protein
MAGRSDSGMFVTSLLRGNYKVPLMELLQISARIRSASPAAGMAAGCAAKGAVALQPV